MGGFGTEIVPGLRRVARHPVIAALPIAVAIAGCGGSAATPAVVAPTATPVPRVALGRVDYRPAYISKLQREASRGVSAGVIHLNPSAVIAGDLPARGFTSAQIYPPLTVPFTYQGRNYRALLTQPIHSGAGGIWIVYALSGASIGTRAVKPALRTRRIQASIDRGKKTYDAYLNPLAALRLELPGLGFQGVVTTPSRLVIRVRQGLSSYDVTLTQPRLRGPEGIWLLARVQAHGPEPGIGM